MAGPYVGYQAACRPAARRDLAGRLGPAIPAYRQNSRDSSLTLSRRCIRRSVRSISTASRARIRLISQTLAAHEFTGQPEFSTAASASGRSRRNQILRRRNRFRLPAKAAGNGPRAASRHGQTMRFDHVCVPEPALSCVLQSPPARDAKAIFGQLASRPSTPHAPRSLKCTAKLSSVSTATMALHAVRARADPASYAAVLSEKMPERPKAHPSLFHASKSPRRSP
jgi:hypothetical protein